MISKRQIKYVKQLEQKKHRQREGAFVAEGPKVVGDLLRCGFTPIVMYAEAGWDGTEAIEVTYDELCKLSFLQHPQQVLAVFRMPTANQVAGVGNTLQLALDGVQDPGNLGTIIRIADWFGINTIFCSPDTVDAWSPKVVQATMGSIARVNIVYTDLAELIGHCRVPVYGTLLDGENMYAQPLSANGLIVMGNEGNGISAPIRKLINRKLFIPSFNQGKSAESLNVAIATAIVCAEFRRRESE